jgi:hypothetical protein
MPDEKGVPAPKSWKRLQRLLGQLGVSKSEALEQWAKKKGLLVHELGVDRCQEKVWAIEEYRMANSRLEEAKEKMKCLGIDIKNMDKVYEEEKEKVRERDKLIFNIATDMSINDYLKRYDFPPPVETPTEEELSEYYKDKRMVEGLKTLGEGLREYEELFVGEEDGDAEDSK